MEVTIEKRVADMELIIGDIPQIMNYRFERFDTAFRDHTARFDEISGRLNLLDKQMGMLLRDMRDLRGGVTRLLVAQDEEIASVKTSVTGLTTDVAELKADVAVLKTDMSEVKSALHQILARLSPA